MKPTVLFIDDDRRYIRNYAEAVEARGFDTQCKHSVDAALKYLREGHATDVIVWDMMMVPGRAFADEDTESGLATGRFLFTEMHGLRPGALFVLLTNDNKIIDAYERPLERSHARSKGTTSAVDFAGFLAEQMSMPGPRSLRPGKPRPRAKRMR